MGEEEGPKVGDGTGDAALAIAEHAFVAGFHAALGHTVPESAKAAHDAWSEYDPPEHIKALS